MIEIKDYKYYVFCDYGTHGYAKHSIGHTDTATELRLNICTQCLIGIITEGLKQLTDEEKSEILKDYLPVSEEEIQQQVAQQEINTRTSQEQESLQNNPAIETIVEGENEAQKLNKEAVVSHPQTSYRDTLLAKAKELGVEGKYVSFTNAMLEKEIEKKLKTGGKQ